MFRINYNLGLVHQAMGLYCSALHFLKAASELKRDDAQIIGAMAGHCSICRTVRYQTYRSFSSVVLSNMNDINNARRAYQKSIATDPKAQVVCAFNYGENFK